MSVSRERNKKRVPEKTEGVALKRVVVVQLGEALEPLVEQQGQQEVWRAQPQMRTDEPWIWYWLCVC